MRVSRRSLLAGGGLLVLGGAAGARARGAAASGPRGARLALLVDLTACASRSGCRACIEACHAGHQVEALPEPRHEVRWVRKEPFARVFPERAYPELSEARRALPVIVTCNHCERAPCVRVCPTGATFRRADGIVVQDEHRCIGCRYCMAACPYGARSFNWRSSGIPRELGAYPGRSAGVVEKCTLCAERIDVGGEPLCVAACRVRGAGALRFGDAADAGSELARAIADRPATRRRPELGTEPHVFYLG